MEPTLLPSGILYLAGDAQEQEMPPAMQVAGKDYNRLIGRIYLPCPTYELTLAQLQDVNRLREQDFKKDALELKNDRLKQLVADTVQDYVGGKDLRVVDIGCGTTTIAPYFNRLSRYIGIDIDPEVVRTLRDKGIESCENKDMATLRLDDTALNALVALYTLHFRLDDHFFEDVAALMNGDDVMLANLYKIPEDRKTDLRTQAEKAGLYVAPDIPDTKISPGRQVFWSLAKDKNRADDLARRFQSGLNGP